MGLGGLSVVFQPNSEYGYVIQGSETTWAKLRSREGNNPDRTLRSLNLT